MRLLPAGRRRRGFAKGGIHQILWGESLPRSLTHADAGCKHCYMPCQRCDHTSWAFDKRKTANSVKRAGRMPQLP